MKPHFDLGVEPGKYIRHVPKEEKIIDKIDSIRAKTVSGSEVDENTKENVEVRSKELFELEAKKNYLFGIIKESLPNEVREYNKSLEKNKFVRQIRPAIIEDFRIWQENETLENYLAKYVRTKFPQEKEKFIEDEIDDRIQKINEILTIEDQIKSIKGAFDSKKSFSELTDEQKTLRIFNNFRIKEIAQSRILRKNYQELIESINYRIEKARERSRFSQIDDTLDPLKTQYSQKLYDEIHYSPDAYYDYWGQYLLEAKRIFDKDGQIFETPYVKAKANKIVDKIKLGNGVFIHGETGTGKTEIAKYISRNKFNKEALIVSGSRGLEIIEMTESQDIQPVIKELPEIQRKEIVKAVAEYQNSAIFKKNIEEISKKSTLSLEDIIKEELDKYEKACVDYNKNRLEITSKMQAIFKAAKDGRMVIIDEMNAIPHHTLIALNDILTKKPLDEETYKKYKNGEISIDKIQLKNKITPIYGLEEFPIAPGFCFIGTGNWKPEDGNNYIGRQTLDTAYLRRFEIEQYDYLPNPTEGTLEGENITPEEERKLKENAELYRMICAKVIAENLSAELPDGTFEKIEELAKAARVIQDAFSGKGIADKEDLPKSIYGTGGELKPEDVVKENVLDLGKLIQYVITPWKADGFRYPIDMYLFDRYISRSSARPEEKVYLYGLFQRRGFFDSNKDWPEIQILTEVLDEEGKIIASENRNERIRQMLEFDKKLDKELYGKPEVKYNNEALQTIEKVPIRYYSPHEVIDKIIGKAPERSRYPNFAEKLLNEGEIAETEILDPKELFYRQETREWVNEIQSDITRKKAEHDSELFLDWMKSTLQNKVKNDIYINIDESVKKEKNYISELENKLKEIEELLDNNAPLEGDDGIINKRKLFNDLI